MASLYGYATLADLEKYAHRDYSDIDATYLADAYVEAAITNAEKYINGYTGTTFTGTIPDDIELVTKMIAKIYIDNMMIEKGIGNMSEANGNVIIDILERFDIVQILEKYKNLYSDNQGIFISKRTHAGVTGTYRRPIGW